MKKRFLLALSLVGLLVTGIGSAGQAATDLLKAQIDFQFTAGDKALPPGSYEIKTLNNDQVIRIQGEGGNSAMVNVITRLAAEIHATPQDSHLVFDKVGNSYLLSEIWIPAQDGYVLVTTKEKHAHRLINIQK